MPDSIQTDNSYTTNGGGNGGGGNGGGGDPGYYVHYGPLAIVRTADSHLPPDSSELQPGLHRVGVVEKGQLGNPAPLGLSGFALTTFVLGCINMGARDITEPNMVVGVAFAYGGLVQLCAGMWEMAVGNTFGATALSSYGGFWISIGITFTPGGFNIMGTYEKAGGGSPAMFYDSLGIFLMGWFIFTFMMILCTLKSTFVFCGTFIAVDLTFLLLGIGYMHRNGSAEPNKPVIKAGGFFALLAAFEAWYVALAGLANDSNSFFRIPMFHMPWARGLKKHS